MTTYQGQFGSYTITPADRREVKVYRSALVVMCGSFALGVAWALAGLPWEGLTAIYGVFCLSLGVALWTIHIYMKLLHRALQGLWGIGVLASVGIALRLPGPLALTVVQYPATIWGVGFVFAALTGLLIKETLCFRWTESSLLVPLVPLVLLAHLIGVLSLSAGQVAFVVIAGLLLTFAARKTWQPLDPDIGDKSVFAYLKSR
ncbi:DUF2301 domain-containing membrane protein [Candidatus Cyanaurora vandensis]|uniref:DUF2301 domain-containing membrane protein n=1 Tax=Candidatus Cyanaurora vandensis TaxID=2714958 RepID=UPI00257A01A8|nr:DUF2301 domain-containing membrane protein [Candidatus Cyanaurora vandensis]